MKSEKEQLADKLVKKFIDNFHEVIGTIPLVKYSINNNAPTLNEIFNCVNDHYKTKVGDDEYSICDNNREATTVHYRSVYYLIARDFNYSFTSIGKLVKKDHATVINGYNKISKNNELANKIKQELNEYINQKTN